MTPEQREVVEFLASPAAFSGGGEVQRIDTHGAHVFLCGDTALKLKRAVRYDYMDLSSPGLRRRMLLRELELNAPAAPTIYRDVLPVTRGECGLELDGTGPALDWVLRMNRFPARDELEAVAARGALDGALADEIGRMVQRFHHGCPVRKLDAAQLIAEILAELGRVLAGFRGAAGTDAVAAWQADSARALAAAAPLLDERGQRGHVRRGHGDLHLRNIVLVDGRPVPFDALEFDERLGTCDVLYDLAFLLMDLCYRGLARAANRAMSEYLLTARGEEDAGLAALPLFLSVRAAIRAMVLLQTDAARDQPGASAAEVATYLAEARAVLQSSPPCLVAVGGLSGTGKTVLARGLAPELGTAPGAVHLSSDAERKAAAGIAPDRHLPSAAYAPGARGEVYDRLLRRAEVILTAGRSVVLDATFLQPARRDQAMALARRLGVPAVGLWLTADPALLEQRLAQRQDDSSDADAAVLRAQLAAGAGPMDWTVLDASGTEAATLVAARTALAAASVGCSALRSP